MNRLLIGAAPLAAVLALTAAGVAATQGRMSAPAARGVAHSQGLRSGGSVQRACNEAPRYGYARCEVLYHTGVRPDVPSGWGATDLESAYNLPSSTMGAGQTVAVVDAYDSPNAASDLQAYEAQYGLPQAEFHKYNQNGQESNYPSANRGWALEESLDVDMMAAGCYKCKILLVEGNSANWSDLETAVKTAANLGATVISNSYSGTGGSSASYNIPGVTILASAGDSGYGIADPADFTNVVAVGGTNLVKGGGSRGWTESAWNGSGSGCSNSSDSKPGWQKAKWTPGCNNKVNNDVAAVATNTAVYDSYGYGGWVEVDGTSISSPLVGSVFGLSGNSNQQTGGKTFWSKKHHKYLYDVTTGSNGNCTPSYLCHAGAGYDGITGWGTPNGVGAF